MGSFLYKKFLFLKYLLPVLCISLSGCGGSELTAVDNAGIVSELEIESKNTNNTAFVDTTLSETESALVYAERSVPDSTENSVEERETKTPLVSFDASDSYFEVHYIDVGQADASLVLCDGASMLIDGGNAEDSSLIYSYLKDHGINHLDYIVCTHPHEDHAGGLSGALNYASITAALSPVAEDENTHFNNFKKYVEKQGVTITVPKPGEVFSLGSAEVSILAPLSESDNANNLSLVMRIVYGDTSFLFTGDAEREVEEELLSSGAVLQSTVLKVPHHGSNSSSTYPFLREVMPTYSVISVGEGNSYGHPSENVVSRLLDAGSTIYRTDELGTIICISDGQLVSFETEKDGTPAVKEEQGNELLPTEIMEDGYVLNTRSKKFHYPDCNGAKKIASKNKEVSEESRDTLISEGYSPCGTCNP